VSRAADRSCAAGLDPLAEHLRDREQLRQSGLLRVVGPDTAIEMIRDFIADVPITHFYSWTLPPGLPPKWAESHLELFASKVIPAFRWRDALPWTPIETPFGFGSTADEVLYGVDLDGKHGHRDGRGASGMAIEDRLRADRSRIHTPLGRTSAAESRRMRWIPPMPSASGRSRSSSTV